MTPGPDLTHLYRAIPAVQELLLHPDLTSLPLNPAILKQLIRQESEQLRSELAEKQPDSADIPSLLIARIRQRAEQLLQPSLKRIINATGIILHTNMGRAPLAATAQQAVLEVMQGYSNLEISLQTGRRGDRQSHCEALLCLLTGAEAALVVNNCAAAILLTLTALCRGREVAISRGELVEIGGSFRMPEVMKFSGSRMVEVGTTNKTHLADYEAVIGNRTAALLKVHCSNYRIVGFSSSVEIAELAQLATDRQVALIYDMGSGLLEDLQPQGYPHEPLVREVIAAGAGVVTFSGDKIPGGPQCGIIVGQAGLLKKIRRHHLARALRCDKMTIAALAATLQLYIRSGRLESALPLSAMLAVSAAVLRQRAQDICRSLPATALQIDIVESPGQIGSGAFPLETLPGIALRLRHAQLPPLKLARRLRDLPLPVIGYVQDDALLLNLRSVQEAELEMLITALKTAGGS